MEDLNAIFHHVVLPPTLPFSQEADSCALGKRLLERLVQACGTLGNIPGLNPHSAACNELVTVLNLWSGVYGEHVDKELYLEALQSILATENQVLALYIVEQNAALLVYCRDDFVVFEAFEASPLSQNVLAAPNALVWKFPSQAAKVPKAHLVDDENLQLALASFLSKATSEHLSQFAATGEKAGISVSESRNPGSPALITHMLLSIIGALGLPATVPTLKKRVRDDVQFRSGTGCRPWRRHPFWLILRVAVRRQLQLSFGVAAGHVAYKLLLSTVTANLLRDAVSQGKEVATVDLLKKKLCRRLAKIEKLPKATGGPWTLDVPGIRTMLQQVVSSANEYIQTKFDAFKRDTVRRIPRLEPRIHPDSEDLRLTLANSRSYLKELTLRYSQMELPVSYWNDDDLNSKLRENPGVLQARGTYDKVSSRLSKLKGAMNAATVLMECYDQGENTADHLCQAMCSILDGLMKSMLPLTSKNTELNSQMCLTLFNIWMNLDELATKAFPLLLDYRPPFPPDLLNVLQLSRLDDMERARQIQVYCRVRGQNATFRERSIFGAIDQRCFGTRFAQSSPDLMACLEGIRKEEQKRREDKKVEWEDICAEYKQLVTEMESLTCCCTYDMEGNRDITGCVHCFKKRQLWRLMIPVCEDVLPEDDDVAAGILFELNAPAAFFAYRNTSWTLLREFAYPKLPNECGKPKMLSEYRDLKTVCGPLMALPDRTSNSVCLASPKKAFMQTHYQDVRMWAEYEELLVPHASAYSMYDVRAKTWVANFDRPVTLAHLCHISIPSPLAHVFPGFTHPPTHPEGPSSYQAVANRPQCPGDMPQHEFEAYHYLLAGRARRWLTLLAELGSSNLNFSKDDTLLTCTHLVHEIGPEDTSQNTVLSHRWILGTCHGVFADDCFVDRLLGEIQKRMDAIRGSWRETNCMDLVLTLALAVYVRATNTDFRQQAEDIVRSIREVMLQWIEALRKEGETSAAAAPLACRYSLRASLLGRHTFALFSLHEDAGPMEPEDVETYLKLSMALQQNRVVDMERLSNIDKKMMKRDAALAYEMQDMILTAIDKYPDAVGAAVAYSIGMAKGVVQSFRPQKIHRGTHRGWITAMILTVAGRQVVDLDCLQGHILVDGKTLRKLPDDIRESADVQELLGQQHLLAYPSPIPGAVCKLAAPVDRYTVHFGRYNGEPVIMAEDGENKSLSYFVPRRIFMDKDKVKYDLPRELVEDCVHWYDRNTGCVEISRKPDIWRHKESNWKLQVTTRQAWRRDSVLVNPDSWTFQTLAKIFSDFEDPQRLTVFQPVKIKDTGRTGTLKIELRHLDLSFSVSPQGLLMCRELGAEIDPDQDAGTLYGYKSMIVMREMADHGRRSIIAPLGPLIWSRRGVHISLQTNIGDLSDRRTKYKISAQEKAYVRFAIDPVLGRLVCPPDPQMLYTKAQLHAFTSFSPLPDLLTGRTGEEEATATLLSGLCQPWEPLDEKSTRILLQLRKLCPTRSFYPTDKRVLQQVTWDLALPTGIQHDRYGHLVDHILDQSDALKPFRDGGLETMTGPAGAIAKRTLDKGTAYLHARAEGQRLRFETPPTHKDAVQDPQNADVRYRSLGQSARFKVAGVQEVARMLYNGDVSVTEDLSTVLERWNHIGGRDASRRTLGEFSLGELLSVETMSERWGSLVGICTQSNPLEQSGELVMALGIMAFSAGVDMDAIRWLAAFSWMRPLQEVHFPPHNVYSRFRFNEAPTQEGVEALITQAYPDFVYRKVLRWEDGKWEVEREREKHWALCQKEGAVLAVEVLRQWPNDLVVTEDLARSAKMISAVSVLEKVRLDWQCLQHNRELSRYTEEVDRTMHQLRLFNPCPEVVELPTTRSGRARAESDSCLGRQEKPPSNVAPRLEDLSRRDMQWKPPTRAPSTSVVPTSPKSRIQYRPTPEVVNLGRLINQFWRFSKREENELRKNYSESLEKSLRALKMQQIQQLQGQVQVVRRVPSIPEAQWQMQTAEQTVWSVYQHIHYSFTVSDTGSWLQQGGLWPRLTTTTILELLRSMAPPVSWGQNVRQILVHYGCVLTEMQQQARIQRALLKYDHRRVLDEVRNQGHANWQPLDHPDWLLLEVDSDMLIRAQQVDVARALLAPKTDANAVLQLNMGQGKTSCIVPMAMAALADGQQLARLIVPKALLPPTAQMVQSRLGGLVGRQIRHLAFSRRLLSRPDISDVLTTYEKHHDDLLFCRGILLVAPEHLLAFKLCGLQYLADSQEEVVEEPPKNQTSRPNGNKPRTKNQRRLGLAQRMIELQDRLSSSLCRDVLDESDVVLATRTQLVYPSGSRSAIDGAPQRWKLAQVLLSLVEDALPHLCSRFSHSISSAPRGSDDTGGNGFPMVQILQMEQIQKPLQAAVMDALCLGQATVFGAWAPTAAALSTAKKQGMLSAALRDDATAEALEAAASLFADVHTARDGLVLVRGLLCDRILLVCLRKRWNVQYGLHPKRCPIAVPYEAKGVPSDRSEFGHPDVAILLTCLAFYYTGLTRDQFRDGLRHILCHHDDPVTAYAHWMAGATSLPADLQQWNVVNPDDENQVDRLYACLRLTRPVIDHYLNTFVFPAHARQFSVKLQASAWDIPLGPRKDKKNRCGSKARTTGFSGTNDNRAMLPLTTQQLDLDPLVHTNAEVLTYLLQPRNCEYQCCMGSGLRSYFYKNSPMQPRWTEKELLKDLCKRHIRVLIDAGAYVLESDNKSLVRAWLTIDHEAEAAIFFGENDNRAWVLFRDAAAGCLPLVATPFVDERRLEECLVYFDEAHTRGVDLLLPANCRGGLTLALGQTKDHTVQAAMRLRQLGTTQSIIWYAPPEVDRSIRHVYQNVTGKSLPNYATLQSEHALLWLLEQTCAANEQLHALYLSQGYDFCRRSAAEKRYRRYTRPDECFDMDEDENEDDNDDSSKHDSGFEYDWCKEAAESNRKVRKQLVDTLQQPERMSLDQLYGLEDKNEKGGMAALKALPPRPAPSLTSLTGMYEQLLKKGFDHSRKLSTTAFEEVEQEREQEREVEVQVEQVRAQKPQVQFTALNFPGRLHWAIESFLVSGGTLPSRHGFHQAFASIARSEMGRRHEVSVAGTKSALYVSAEFERTIQLSSGVQTIGTTAKGKAITESVAPVHDQFFRPVQWLLWSRLTETAIVVVPEEAELLLLWLRRKTATTPAITAHIHLLLYSAAVTRAMVDLSSGTYYAVPSLPPDYALPSWLTIEAGILGGRLYMPFAECEAMRAYLENAVAQDDADAAPSFCPNLPSFLLDWLPLRRIGQDISYTPAAYVCQGRPLHEKHAFFVR